MNTVEQEYSKKITFAKIGNRNAKGQTVFDPHLNLFEVPDVLNYATDML